MSALQILKVILMILSFSYFNVAWAAENPVPPIVLKKDWAQNLTIASDIVLNQALKQYKFITIHFYPYNDDCGADVPQSILNKLNSSSAFEQSGFHYLVDTCGQIYEGSKLNETISHAGKYWLQPDNQKFDGNKDNLAILLPASSNKKSTVAQLAKTIWLIDYLTKNSTIKQIYNVEDLVKEARSCQMTFVALASLKISLTMSQQETYDAVKSFFPRELYSQTNLICKPY